MSSIDKRSPQVTNSTLLSNPGPYIARVVNNVDPMKQGALEVELLRAIGNQKEAGQQTFVVRYCSPFYGVTDFEHNGTDNFDFNHTQKSYGFWAVPPDTGCLVMVIFIDSDPGQGFWIGCVQDAVMNHMVPGIAASVFVDETVRDSDEKAWKDTKQTVEKYGTTFLPVGEVNRKVFKSGKGTPNPDVEANKKPVHPLADVFLRQGLINDVHRGPNTSSSRRESPSNVYGWSTPGPLDKRQNAQKGKVGRAEDKITKFVSRLGGHCIIMDDGNDRRLRKSAPWEGPPEYADLERGETGGLVEWPEDEAFRIRTRTGHQIILHNAEDFIYICNSRGTAWIELTSNGKIDFYAQDGISFRSEQDFNFHSERDVNFSAGRSVNVQANNNYTVNSNNDVNIKTPTAINITAGNSLEMRSDNYARLTGTTGVDLHGRIFRATGGASMDLSTGGSIHASARSGNFEVYAGGSSLITSGNELNVLTGGHAKFQQMNLDFKTTESTKTQSETIDNKASKTIHTEAGGEIGIKTDAELKMTSKGAASLSSSDKTLSLQSKGQMNVKTKDKLVLNGNQVAVKSSGNVVSPPWQPGGEDAKDADKAPAAAEAKTALQASVAVAAVQAGSAAELVSYPTPNVGGGGSIGKRAPHTEPYDQHENQNPQGHIPTLTDRDVADMPYGPNEPRKTIGSSEDSARADPEGTGAGGGADASAGAARSNPDLSAGIGGPPTDSQIQSFPADWTKDKPFLSKAQQLAGKYGVSQEEFLAFLYFESNQTMSPSIKNRYGYTGLIQFGNAAASEIGTTTSALARMSRAEQLNYVEKYLDMWRGRKKISGGMSLEKLYMLVALPAYVNAGPNDILAAPNGPNAAIWRRNPPWREGSGPYKSRVGPITQKSIGQEVRKFVDKVRARLGGSSGQAGMSGGQ